MNKLQQLIDRFIFKGEIERLADDNLNLIAECEAMRAAHTTPRGWGQCGARLRNITTAEITISENTAGAYEWHARIAGALIDRGQRSTADDAQRDATRAVVSHISQRDQDHT